MPKRTTRKQRRRTQRREEYPQRVIQWWKDTMRQRIERSAELMEKAPRAFRGDLHVHSTYSDGVGTVDEIKAYGDSAGLDFIFITDHGGINQKRSCVKYSNVWWGQEPGTQYHHLGILGLDRKYTPKRDLVYDYNRIKALGGFPFIPHPTGWFPTTRYSEDQKQALEWLGDEFAIEVINGANQIFDCFDVTDAMTLELWDQHLCQGKRVTGLGCTDAHLPQAMGDVWTGVFCDALQRDAVIEAVRQGHCFTSDAPLVWLGVNGCMMGDTVRSRPAEIAAQARIP